MNQVVYQMRHSQIYKDEYKLWIAKPVIDQTWDQFKTHFLAAYHDKLEDDQFGSKGAGFSATTDERKWEEEAPDTHMANTLNNLANAVTADAQHVATLTATNKTLTETNSTLAAQLKVALENNRVLTLAVRKKFDGGTKNDDGHHNNKRPCTKGTDGRGEREVKPWDLNGYCWTHGIFH